MNEHRIGPDLAGFGAGEVGGRTKPLLQTVSPPAVLRVQYGLFTCRLTHENMQLVGTFETIQGAKKRRDEALVSAACCVCVRVCARVCLFQEEAGFVKVDRRCFGWLDYSFFFGGGGEVEDFSHFSFSYWGTRGNIGDIGDNNPNCGFAVLFLQQRAA